MAHVFRRLIALAVLVLFAAFSAVPVFAQAIPPNQGSFATASAAQTACTTYSAYAKTKTSIIYNDCVTGYNGTKNNFYFWSGIGGGYFNYPAGTESTICSARPPLHQAFDGTTTSITNAGCTYKLKQDDDGAVKVCGVWNGKQYCTGSATWVPTGDYSTSGPPPAAADPTPAAPKVCQGGSCYDPAGNQYCASSSGGQVCVPAPSSNAPGGCSTGGNTTLCAGSPVPTPPNPPVSDPPSQIASSDGYTSQKGSGSVSNVTVNNFNGAGTGAKNGAGSSDLGAPASSSTAPTPPGDGTSAGGGGDCNTPPMVEGSPALGMIARQTWLLRCAEAGQVTDDSNTTVPGLDAIPNQPDASINKEITVTDKLDFSGFGGGGQCPKLPNVDLGMFGHYDLQSDWWCDFLNKLSFVMVLLGVWRALVILGDK